MEQAAKANNSPRPRRPGRGAAGGRQSAGIPPDAREPAARSRQPAAGGERRHRRDHRLLARAEEHGAGEQAGGAGRSCSTNAWNCCRASCSPICAARPPSTAAPPTGRDQPSPPLREVIARHGLAARRALGQHFLLDANLTTRIVRRPGPLAGRHVVEVGPGPGGLTRALLASAAASVTVIEIDRRAVAAMRELAELAAARLHVVAADALAIDAASLVPPPRQVIANLPYNIATPLLVGWLRQAVAFERLTLMFQQEVAERICAAPGLSSLRAAVRDCPMDVQRDAVVAHSANGVRASAEGVLRRCRVRPACGAARPGPVRANGASHCGGIRPEAQDAARRAEAARRREPAAGRRTSRPIDGPRR